MARLKPRVTIPYKRYERSFERSVDNSEQIEDGLIVHKDITANPAMAVNGLKPGRPDEEEEKETPAPDSQKEEQKPTSDLKELTLNKKIKIRRKTR